MESQTINIIQSLRWLAVKKCETIEDAEDLLQDVFIRLFRNEKFNSIVKEEEKKKFISRCINNMSIDFHRRRSTKKGAHTLPVIEEYTDHYYNHEPEAYSKIELKEVLKKCEGREICDTLIAMAAGYKASELSNKTGIGINTIIGRCRYARKFLRA